MLEMIGEVRTCPHGHPIGDYPREPGEALPAVPVGSEIIVLRLENEAEEMLHYMKRAGVEPGRRYTVATRSRRGRRRRHRARRRRRRSTRVDDRLARTVSVRVDERGDGAVSRLPSAGASCSCSAPPAGACSRRRSDAALSAEPVRPVATISRTAEQRLLVRPVRRFRDNAGAGFLVGQGLVPNPRATHSQPALRLAVRHLLVRGGRQRRYAGAKRADRFPRWRRRSSGRTWVRLLVAAQIGPIVAAFLIRSTSCAAGRATARDQRSPAAAGRSTRAPWQLVHRGVARLDHSGFRARARDLAGAVAIAVHRRADALVGISRVRARAPRWSEARSRAGEFVF